MIVVIPEVTPVTTPVNDPAVATPGVPEVHTPPPVASLKIVFEPIHTTGVPVITPGEVSTLNDRTTKQPVVKV